VRAVRILLIGTMIAASLAACGGSDTSSGDGQPDAVTTTTTGEAMDTSGGSTSAASHAEITIGDLTYTFDISGLPTQCSQSGPYLQGSFALDASGAAVEAGGPDVSVQLNFGIPPEDWESEGLSPGSVGVEDLTTNEYWLAAADVGPADGTIGITTINLDGDHATGTATFLEINGFYAGSEPRVAEGTYDITCGTG
jgi:hypothetical protein